MHHIGTSKALAEELLLALHRHLPPGHRDLGRPYAVTSEHVLAIDGQTVHTFGLSDGGCEAWRVAVLRDGTAEYTRWAYGEELDRRLMQWPGPMPEFGESGCATA